MTDISKRSRASSPHVVFAYTDDDDDDDDETDHQQESSLLPIASTGKLRKRSNRKCCCWWKRLILVISVLAICIGIFETVFHGKEGESLQAARDKISQLEQKLSEQVKGGFDRVMATISHPTPVPHLDAASDSNAVRVDGDIEAVKSKSVIVLKTGASVLADRLPAQLVLAQTAFLGSDEGNSPSSSPSFIIYSDAADQIGSYTIHNALAKVSDFVRHNPTFPANTTSFTLYSTTTKIRLPFQTVGIWTSGSSSTCGPMHSNDTPLLNVSLDPRLFERNNFRMRFDLMRNHELFANGGCPYIISGALMRSTFGKDPNFASRFDKEVEQSCCGDAEMSIALRRSATVPIRELGNSGARFQNQRPREIVFDADNWCGPIVNFHHLNAWEMVELSKMETEIRRRKRDNETVLYSDVFDYIIPRNLKIALDESTRSTTSEVDLYPYQVPLASV